MTEKPDEILSLLPARLKDARRAQGLSLEAVSKLSGVSRSMVSQIERGESSPTVATLWNLTQALKVDFAGLLDDQARPKGITVLREADIPTIDNRGQGCRISILSPPESAGENELYRLSFSHGGQLISDPHGRGAEEQFTVVSGKVRVQSGQDLAELGPGDSARYAGDVAHSLVAVDGPADGFLSVKSP